MQHRFSHAARLLLLRSVSHQFGRSKASFSTEPKARFRDDKAGQLRRELSQQWFLVMLLTQHFLVSAGCFLRYRRFRQSNHFDPI